MLVDACDAALALTFDQDKSLGIRVRSPQNDLPSRATSKPVMMRRLRSFD